MDEVCGGTGEPLGGGDGFVGAGAVGADASVCESLGEGEEGGIAAGAVGV